MVLKKFQKNSLNKKIHSNSNSLTEFQERIQKILTFTRNSGLIKVTILGGNVSGWGGFEKEVERGG